MFKLLKNFTIKDWTLTLFILILIIFEVWLNLKMPDYMAQVTKLVETEGSDMAEILTNGSYMLLCAVGSLITAVITGYITADVSSNFSMHVRNKLFEKVENLSMREVTMFSTSSLITRTTNDITQVEELISTGLQSLLKAPIIVILALTKTLNKNWQWSLITGIALLILLFTIGILMLFVLPRFKAVQGLSDKLNVVTRENLTGIRVIRAFNAESYQENKFEAINESLTDEQLYTQKTLTIMQPVMYLVMYGLPLAIYLVGAYIIENAAMTDRLSLFGNMVVFSSYAMQVIMSFLMLSMVFMMLLRAKLSANRINEVLDTEISVKNGDLKENKTDEIGTVEFKDVSFKYPDAKEYLLENISFKARRGQTIAFIGATGSGKSTLINLVPRFYDATKGEVLVDGINVKEYDEEFLHNKLGYAPQKAVIFSGTLKSNIAYGKNGKASITDVKIKEALKVAQVSRFVEKMEGQYNAHMAPRGTNVSGGQKQRLSIARAIAKEPEIYIFDDSFSALDYKTDRILRKALKEYTKKATILIVAQRVGTIMNADKIVVLDNGKIVGQGTHKELLKSCETYKQIALSQLSKEELENG